MMVPCSDPEELLAGMRSPAMMYSWIVTPLSAMSTNQYQWFIYPPGVAVMMEAEALPQHQISCSYCIIVYSIWLVCESVIPTQSTFNDY